MIVTITLIALVSFFIGQKSVKFLDRTISKTLEKENFATSVVSYSQALSNYIPYFDKKRHTVASLLHSGNPYAYLLGKHLRDVVKKETSYTLQDIDIYNHAQVVLGASKAEVVNAKYNLEKFNKRDI